MPRKGRHLLASLQPDNGAAGVFGICYSVLTWTGVGKGLSFWPRSWLKTTGKLFENGHATTFLIELADEQLTLTGMGDAWVFETDHLDTLDWARDTGSADTFVYYISVDAAFVARYQQVRQELEGRQDSYAVLWPNLPGNSRYENCVSHCHYLMYKLGIARWISTKGWWVPSTSNWVDWFKTFAPTRYGGWKYTVFRGTNTHIP